MYVYNSEYHLMKNNSHWGQLKAKVAHGMWGAPKRFAGVLPSALLNLFPLPSSPPPASGYVYKSSHLVCWCCFERWLEVGCGFVAMVTSFMLRKLLPSSVTTLHSTYPPKLLSDVLRGKNTYYEQRKVNHLQYF